MMIGEREMVLRGELMCWMGVVAVIGCFFVAVVMIGGDWWWLHRWYELLGW